LRREAALLERVDTLVTERDRVRAALLDQGWEVPVSEGNFVWLALGEAAVEFAAACDEAGVAVRAFPGEGCRITVAEPEASDVLLRTAAEWRKNRS
jgi:histidinol-phosphate aminotransferase